MALLYPNLRDAEPFRISEKVISGEEASQSEPEKRCISYVCILQKDALTISYALAATPVIARGLYTLDRKGLGVHGQSAQGHRAPTLSVGTLLA